MSDLAQRTEEVLTQIVEKMHVSASVEVSQSDSTIDAAIEGEDAAILIGREGRTLDALQLLVNIMVNRGREEDRVRVVVDVEGYKGKRAENLEQLANSLAQKVAQEKQPLSMEPMNAFDRRIIHMALRESTEVITESQGEGSERHIVIKPL